MDRSGGCIFGMLSGVLLIHKVEDINSLQVHSIRAEEVQYDTFENQTMRTHMIVPTSHSTLHSPSFLINRDPRSPLESQVSQCACSEATQDPFGENRCDSLPHQACKELGRLHH